VPGALLYRENSDTPLHVVEGTAIADGPGWRIRLAEAPDRTAADGLRGAYLEADVPATEAPTGDPTAGSWLWHEIVGLSVAGRDGEELGTVIDIYRVAENDVYVVRGPRGEFDVPAVRDFVDSIDPAQRSLVINGLALDLPPVRPPRPYRAPRPRKGDAARAAAIAAAALAEVSPAAQAPANPGSGDEPGPVADVVSSSVDPVSQPIT
jgi:16S rRNA processing protein RimM